jgi:hypothetical protein
MAVTETAKVLAMLLPQLLTDDTDIVPLAVPAVVVIELVVDVPVHPDGNTHV